MIHKLVEEAGFVEAGEGLRGELVDRGQRAHVQKVPEGVARGKLLRVVVARERQCSVSRGPAHSVDSALNTHFRTALTPARKT